MAIIVDIDVMLARRKMSVGALAEAVGITPANLAVLKNGRAKAVRFSTLNALCAALNCDVGDILRYEPAKLNEPARPNGLNEAIDPIELAAPHETRNIEEAATKNTRQSAPLAR